LPHDSLRAAYLNVNDRDGTKMYEPADIVATRDTLIEGILDDMQRIAGGATLAALGEGAACDYCAARGLCRKDFWELSA
jgi:ATP-dependent helicase/nuclease subunit B